MDMLKNINNACRFILEVIAILSVGYWGLKLNSIGAWRYIVGVCAPLIIVVVWSVWGAPMAEHRLDGFYRLVLETIIFSIAVACLYATHQKSLAVVIGIFMFINTVLLYFLK